MRHVVDGMELQFVYKTSIFDHALGNTNKKWEGQRKDVLVMEKTTKSKFIPNVHGYCGLANTMDFMPDGDLFDYIMTARYGSSTLRSVDKLRIAM